jgi:hypothetical protein
MSCAQSCRDMPSLPVQPLIVTTQEEPGMFDFFRRYETPAAQSLGLYHEMYGRSKGRAAR